MNNTYYGKLIFELSKKGRIGYSLPNNEFKDYHVSDLSEGRVKQFFLKLTSKQLHVITPI